MKVAYFTLTSLIIGCHFWRDLKGIEGENGNKPENHDLTPPNNHLKNKRRVHCKKRIH